MYNTTDVEWNKERATLIVINANWHGRNREIFISHVLSPFVPLIPHVWPITPLYDAYRMTWKSLREADLGLLTGCALLNGARVDVIWHNRKANLSRVLSAPRRPVLRGRTEIRFEIRGNCGEPKRVCAFGFVLENAKGASSHLRREYI